MYASKKEKYESISKGVINLEEQIDKMNSKLSSLKSFILPGGSKKFFIFASC